MKKSCENCIHSYYEDIWFELCCDIDKKYIGENNAKEKARECKHYKKEKED